MGTMGLVKGDSGVSVCGLCLAGDGGSGINYQHRKPPPPSTCAASRTVSAPADRLPTVFSRIAVISEHTWILSSPPVLHLPAGAAGTGTYPFVIKKYQRSQI
jgi:hypothetical protein